MSAYGKSPLVDFTRSSEANYTDSNGTEQTAAVDQPRWDYDADTLEFLGLLMQRSALAGGAPERLNGPIGGEHNTDGFTVRITARTAAAYVEDQVLWQMDDGTEANRIRLVRQADTHVHLQASSGGSQIVDIDLGAVVDETEFEVVIRAGDGEYAARLDESSVQSAAGSRPSGVNVRRFGGPSEHLRTQHDAEWSDGSAWTWSDGSAVEWIINDDFAWDGHVRIAREIPRLQSNAEMSA